MKFKLATAKYFYREEDKEEKEEIEKLRKRGFVFGPAKRVESLVITNEPEIEIKSLEDLMNLYREWDSIVIHKDYEGKDEIIIYNDYLE